jgi:serine/threonine-protein kinase
MPDPDAVTRLNAALEGRYHIERELGEGGMATVYLADDLKHERKVAVKVLKPELAAVVGAERFLAEIKTTANLQHPHILPLHDSGEADGFLFYVMPYVEGETLEERLERQKQLPVDDAVRIAVAVASALDYAHRNDVIHRDIKPANILLHDDEPVVADFGIALAVGTAGGNRLTETGLSVGTPYYMSPEQATGDQIIGPASDTYALACVLYQMLVGEPPYLGGTAQAVLGKIISGVPVTPTQHRPSIPPNVDAAIRQALEKLPADRFASAQDFAKALQDPGFRYGVGGAAAAAEAAGPWKAAALGLGGIAALMVAALGWTALTPEPPAPVARYGLAFPPGQELMDLPAPTFAIGSGGSWLAYVGPGDEGGQLWVKARDRWEATPYPGTGGARSPSISADEEWISFVTGAQLRKVPVQGGAPITLADDARAQGGPASWLDDGTVVFIGGEWQLRRVSADGGPTDTLWAPPEDRFTLFPAALPNARGLLFTLCDPQCANSRDAWIVDLESGEARELIPGAQRAYYASTGHVVFVRPDGNVFAAPFDPGALELTGPAVPVLEGVKVDGIFPDMHLAPDGALLTMQGQGVEPGPREEVVWVTRDGVVRPVDPGWLIDNARNFGWALSPDGTRLAIALTTEEGDDIWIKELDEGPLSRLTYHETEDARPRWSADGELVYFLSRRREGPTSDLWVRRADGADQARAVLEPDRQLWETTATPDGKWVVARAGGQTNQQGARDIVAYSLEGDSAEVPLLTSDYDEVAPQLSPDGRWLAHASEESGRYEVYVRPFPDVESGRWTVSTEGGTSPRWAHSGRELFYVGPGRQMMVASVSTGSTFSVEDRQPLFEIPQGFALTPLGTAWDVSPDDQRFIMTRTVIAAENVDAPLILVENWYEELKARTGG